jgi:hypothetical protein
MGLREQPEDDKPSEYNQQNKLSAYVEEENMTLFSHLTVG